MKKQIIKMISMVLAFVLFAGAFGMVPMKEVNATTLPIGVGPELPINKVIVFDNKERNTDHYYTLTVQTSGYIKGHALATSVDDVEIRDADDNEVMSHRYFWEDDFKIYLRQGKYSVRIRTGSNTPHKCVFYFTSVNETFRESETSNNDSEDTPSRIASLTGQPWIGVIAATEENDYYSFNIKKSSIVDFTLAQKTDDMNLSYILTKGDGTYITDSSSTGVDGKQSFALAAGTYRINISAKNQGIYTFKLKANEMDTGAKTVLNKAPKVKALKKGKLKISWSKYAKADGYQIQVAKKKNFKGAKSYVVKSNRSSKKVTLIKNMKGKKVYVRIRPYKLSPSGSKVYTSKWSKAVSVKSKK